MKKLEMIEEKVLRQGLSQGQSVALVRVLRLEPIYQGTRGAKVIIHLEVERQLQGALPRHVKYWVYGSPELVQLAPRLLIVAQPPQAGRDEIGLVSAVDVPEGMEDQAVQAHEELIARLGKPSLTGK